MGATRGKRSAGDRADDAARVSARAGTRVAFGLPALGLALLGLWLTGAHGSAPSLWALVVLPAMCAGYGIVPLALGPRMYASFESPTVVLAGLVGGPAAGVVAGIATGLGDVRAVWRRRCAYAGLTMLYGFTAGLAGDAWRSGATALVPAVAAACLGYLVISVAGFAVVILDRQSYRTDRVVQALRINAAEIACGFPLIALCAVSFASRPALVAGSVASLLAVVACGSWALTRQRELVESERRARHHDTLTGALTRVAFDDALKREHARVIRGDHSSGLVVCDLDHFARFNKRYGHLGGDAALKFAVEQITRATRASDIVSRWGGEELCVIAPDIGSLKELGALCERIRAAVAGTAFPVGSENAAITISVGATLLTDVHTVEQTFARADEALYRAKQTRDACCVVEPLPADPDGASVKPVGASVS